MDKKSSNPQTMEVDLTDNSESKDTLQVQFLIPVTIFLSPGAYYNTYTRT